MTGRATVETSHRKPRFQRKSLQNLGIPRARALPIQIGMNRTPAILKDSAPSNKKGNACWQVRFLLHLPDGVPA
ncbi:hypothetical protein ACPPVV_01720 [Rhodanobacter sp. Col0626]|uniref:hypothetical protein n=1 Tax=Rhodanobacter sp. Col0626 TaxID=3415679 RepID=UPI003CF26C9A